jgi:hypothetical protein
MLDTQATHNGLYEYEWLTVLRFRQKRERKIEGNNGNKRLFHTGQLLSCIKEYRNVSN